ncbi:GNAT family N-acetyltransferase [Xylophilus sp. Kf1]|nr:GNAT family N-acetyltransferase [Xylophilus sp. Kf1]
MSTDTGPLPWREQAGAFAALHHGRPTLPFIANLEAEVHGIDAGPHAFPVTVSAPRPDNAWVVSPVTTYGRYATEESERLAPAWARPALRGATGWATREMLATGLERAVSVNNWLVSTNLYPPLETRVVETLRDQCIARWPTSAVWLRSLNRVQHGPWLDALVAAGFRLIPTRQVYLFQDLRTSRRSNLRQDLALLRRTALRPVAHQDFRPADFERGEQLYARLYLQKYSGLNPAYTAGFLRAWHQAGLLRMSGWRGADGELLAVVGVFCQGDVSTAPIVGYDTGLPQSLGLYRLLMAQVFRHALDSRTVLNLSAGAAGFKRLRGGLPAIEYSAVHARHLPARARRFLWILHAVTHGFGVPLMKAMKL